MNILLSYLYPTRPNKNGNNLLLRKMKRYVDKHHNNNGEIIPVEEKYNQSRKELIRLINSGKYNINIQNKDGYTALMYASKILTFQKIVELLLEKGAKLNLLNNDGDTALIIASDYYHLDIVNILVENGANLDLQNNDGNTALIIASDYYHLDRVNILVENGASLDFQNNTGNTALIYAVNHGKLDIVKILVEKGANINLQNNYGDTALGYVKKKIEIIQEQIKKLLFTGKNIYGLKLKRYKNKLERYKAIHDYLILKSTTKPNGGGKKVSLKNYTILDLKSMCRAKKLKNYSNLNKESLVKLLKKNN